jgi:hypothetical protein
MTKYVDRVYDVRTRKKTLGGTQRELYVEISYFTRKAKPNQSVSRKSQTWSGLGTPEAGSSFFFQLASRLPRLPRLRQTHGHARIMLALLLHDFRKSAEQAHDQGSGQVQRLKPLETFEISNRTRAARPDRGGLPLVGLSLQSPTLSSFYGHGHTNSLP